MGEVQRRRRAAAKKAASKRAVPQGIPSGPDLAAKASPVMGVILASWDDVRDRPQAMYRKRLTPMAQMQEPFVVDTPHGRQFGEPGDYVARERDGTLSVVSQHLELTGYVKG